MDQDLFAPAKDAGLRQSELAELGKVSRLTAGKWMNGKSQPHPLHVDKIHALMNKIQSCIEAGTLPVSPRLKGDARRKTIFSLVLGDVR